MTSSTPPAADDEDAYVFLDHHEEPGSIIKQVSERLAPEHPLTARVDEDAEHLFATYRGQEGRIPLTLAWYDQYVEISSLAELMKDDYRFFVLAPTLGDDTHGLLVAPSRTRWPGCRCPNTSYRCSSASTTSARSRFPT